MERVALVAEQRQSGKGRAKRQRAAGRVPAILYGKTVKPIALSVNRREVEKAVKTKAGMNVLVDLSITGGDSGLALIRDFQADPFRRDFTHIDFQAISLNERIDVEVPITFIGTSVGVKEGGVVEALRRTIHISALPEKIPERIEVDISALKIGDSIHADEVSLPEGIDFPHALNYTIVTIVPPAKEEVAPVAAAVVEGAVEGALPTEGAAAPAAAGDAKAAPAAKPAGKDEKKAPKAEEKKAPK